MQLVKENLDLTLYEDSRELVNATARQMLEFVAQQLIDNGVCHIALTGGTLGEAFSHRLVELLNSRPNDFAGLHIWFSDERFTTSDSPLRNSRPVQDGLQNSLVFVHEVASTDDAITVIEAAASYNAELCEVIMDICLLGLGPDGHVASLFPSRFDPQEQARAIAILDSPKPPVERVTFSMNYINASEQVWIIASGEAKAHAVTQLLEGSAEIPAGHISAHKITRLIIDNSALFTQH